MKILLTGTPGIGKTTAIRRIASLLGDRAGGFLTGEIREGGRRTGFAIESIDGRREILADRGALQGPRIGPYTVIVKNLEAVAIPALESAGSQGRIILIDEIGKMEMESAAVRRAILGALDGPARVVATLGVARHPFMDAVRARRDVNVIEIKRENRDDVPRQVLDLLDRGGTRLLRCLAAACLIMLAICSQSFCGSDSREGGNAEMQKGKARQPAVAGSFYPGSEKALREAVTSMLAAASPPSLDGKVVGLIAPHAGYIYSGQIAAYAYRTVQGQKFDAVIVISPSHHVYFKGSSIYREGPYMTPLGTVGTAEDIADKIAEADKSVTTRPDAHTQEHALEVQVPFLQVAIPDLKLVPIVMGDQSLETCRGLADAIVDAVKGKNVLLVASSDLSHFHTYDEAEALDKIVADRISGYDPESLTRDLDLGRCEACGGGPIVTVMLAARKLGASKAIVLKQGNSGDVTGDRSNVVGYLAAALTAPGKPGSDPAPGAKESKDSKESAPEAGSVGVDLGLRNDEKAQLLRIARQSIEAAVLGKSMPQLEVDSPLLNQKMGAFVTLTEAGELRGCIGHIVGTQALYKTVSEMAVAAATEDPRFAPLAPEELKQIAIEISVLTPLKRITDANEIVIGRDGIYLEKGYSRGLLLPQVATEYNWDRYQFLDHTCLKAGLEPGSWRQGANIQTFSAQVFNEADVLGKGSSK